MKLKIFKLIVFTKVFSVPILEFILVTAPWVNRSLNIQSKVNLAICEVALKFYLILHKTDFSMLNL